MVERNGADYEAYLCNVFADDPAFQAAARAWAAEEVQHGEALARWATLADPALVTPLSKNRNALLESEDFSERIRDLRAVLHDVLERQRAC